MPRIKQLLAAGQVVRVFAAGQLLSPKLIEIVGEHGEFDALWLDFEHAGISMKEIELATMAAKAYGMDHFVRLPATDYASVMRPLEAGAGGIMISMVRSASEAEQAVRWAKFWPRGERGLNGGNRDGRFGLMSLPEYMAAANAATSPVSSGHSTRSSSGTPLDRSFATKSATGCPGCTSFWR